ncbi:MAG: transcriptional repressor LexA [Candidatus Sumerlaeaceae bacterium]
MPIPKLPDKQKKILEFIRSEHSSTGVYPSVREIAAHMEFKSTNTVDYHLRRMEAMGAIERGGRRARSFSVAGGDRGTTRARSSGGYYAEHGGVPLLGRVAAGEPILAEQHYDGMVNFSSLFHCDDQTFALKVLGDSMVEAGIVDGDLVIVRHQPNVANGEIGVAVIGNEATVKRIYDEGSSWRLQPENTTMKPIVVKKGEEDFSIAGRVVGVVRKM